MTYGPKRITETITFKVVLGLHIAAVSLFLVFEFTKEKPDMVKVFPIGLTGMPPGSKGDAGEKTDKAETSEKTEEAVVAEPAPVAPIAKPAPVVKQKSTPVVKPKPVVKTIPKPKPVVKTVPKPKPPVKKKTVEKKKPKETQAQKIARMRFGRKKTTRPKVKIPTFDPVDPNNILKGLGKGMTMSPTTVGGGGMPGSYRNSVGAKFAAEWYRFGSRLRSNPTELVKVNVTWNKYGTITSYSVTSNSNDATLNSKAKHFLSYMKSRVKLPPFPSSMKQSSVTKSFQLRVVDQ